jgi:predicted GNAT family acetyltransferase
VQLAFCRGVAGLPTQVDEFVAARVERNVQASLLVHARAGLIGGDDPLFVWGQNEGGEIAFFAMRIPPWPMLVSDLDAQAANALMELWLEHDPSPPGVNGTPGAARAVGAAWERHTNGSARCRMREAMHLLREVVDPESVPAGELRPANERDRDLLVAWERAFVHEAGLFAGAAQQAEQAVLRRLHAGAQFVWEDAQPVSTLALSPPIASTVRIGPVYTPPEHRRRGYASAAVARASHGALAGGADQCMLFTDLANPTSNKIYAAVGFRRVGDWEELEFSRR